jgi:hypothetical protein
MSQSSARVPEGCFLDARLTETSAMQELDKIRYIWTH